MKSIIILNSRRRRGSVFVLVVAILAVLGLMTLTLSYSSRVELKASRNSVDFVQARLAVLTGVPFVNPGTPPTFFATSAGASGASGPGGNIPNNAAFGSSGSLTLRPSSGRPALGSSSSAVTTVSPRPSDDQKIMMSLAIDPKALAKSRARQVELEKARQREPQPVSGLTHKDINANGPAAGANGVQAPEVGSAEVTEGGDAAKFRGTMTENVIEDESGKLNINAILPSPSVQKTGGSNAESNLTDAKRPEPPVAPTADDFAYFIDATLKAKKATAHVSAQELADAILLRRYGKDQKPGVAGTDDNGNSGQANPGSDGLDNDQDGVIDNPEEQLLGPDADGVDNNRNGVIDEPGESILNDGIDNDVNGQIDDADEATDEASEFSPDIRLRPRGDDQPFGSLNDLMSIKGMTIEAFRALEPHLTVFSVSQPAYPEDLTGESVMGFRQLDPNTASARDIYDALHRRYPLLPIDLIGQFAVNIVDRRDADDVPTIAQLGSDRKSYTGFELTPRINEVFPYTGSLDQTESGDDGQFVEIVNPYTRSLDLSGWRLEGGGITVWLRETLPAQGYLVITDDYNDSLDDHPEDTAGQGSLFNLFGVVPTGPDAQIRAEPLFNLKNDTGAVTLINREGISIDTFKYKDGNYVGGLKRSFQRKDPREQKEIYTSAEADTATPIHINRGAADVSEEDRKISQIVEKLQNQPFHSPVELMMVLTNYTPSGAADALGGKPANPASGENQPQSQQQAAQGLRFASIVSGETDNFDAGIVDAFMPGLPTKRNIQLVQPSVLDPAGNPAVAVNLAELKRKALLNEPPAMHGRININTAPTALLASLPGIGPEIAERMAKLREECLYGVPANQTGVATKTQDGQVFAEEWFKPLAPQESVRWRGLSDLIKDDELWGTKTAVIERLNAVYPFSRMIAFNSLGYHVITQNIATPSSEKEKDRHATMMLSDRIVAGDRGKPEVVSFRYLGLAQLGKDPDTDYGVSDGKIEDYAKKLTESLPKSDHGPARYKGPALDLKPKASGLDSKYSSQKPGATTTSFN